MRRCHTIFMARRNFFHFFFAVAQLSRKSKSYYYYFDVRQVRHGTVVVRQKSLKRNGRRRCVCAVVQTHFFSTLFHVDWNKRVWHKSTNQLTVMAAKKRLQQTNTNHFFPPKQTHNSQNQIQTVVLFSANLIKIEDIFQKPRWTSGQQVYPKGLSIWKTLSILIYGRAIVSLVTISNRNSTPSHKTRRGQTFKEHRLYIYTYIDGIVGKKKKKKE